MNSLETVLRDNAFEAVGDALYEQDISIVIDWKEASDDVVCAFARHTDGALSYELTANDDLELKYQSQVQRVGLQENPGDIDRTLRAIRRILAADFAIRVLKSSLDADTFEFVIATHEQWRKLDGEFGVKTEKIFVPFTDAIVFGG